MAQPPPAVRRKRWLKRILLSLLAIVLIAVFVLWWMISAKPDYWHVLDGSHAEVRTAGERVEQTVSSLITRVRPTDQSWQLPLSDKNINHWLAARMPNWLANQNIDPSIIAVLRHAQVHCEPDRLLLAVQPDLGVVSPVIELTLVPRPSDSGAVELYVKSAKAGVFDVPIDTIIEKFANNRSVPRELTLEVPLKDGREVQVTDLGLTDSAMMLTCTTRRVSRR
ncbi:hypothetical protein HED60_18860 [Planctomycetales bacterium ZRK34]|nr:hypothetical protein HED60_18860 [Planctomycetales bacterium ZRK34]